MGHLGAAPPRCTRPELTRSTTRARYARAAARAACAQAVSLPETVSRLSQRTAPVFLLVPLWTLYVEWSTRRGASSEPTRGRSRVQPAEWAAMAREPWRKGPSFTGVRRGFISNKRKLWTIRRRAWRSQVKHQSTWTGLGGKDRDFAIRSVTHSKKVPGDQEWLELFISMLSNIEFMS